MNKRLVARRDDTLAARITEAFALPGVRAGSALLRVGTRLLAVQDDAFDLAWIDPATRAIELLPLRAPGGPLPKKLKPDFEAVLAAGADTAWVLGSGSKANRCSIARLSLAGPPRAVLRNAVDLYRVLAEALGGPPNIEGAVRVDGRLRLFHRGPGRTPGASALLELPAACLDGAAPGLPAVARCDLGTLEGLALGFTDAVALDARRVLYLAVAEDTPDGIADGPIAGAAVGLMEGEALRWGPLLEADGTLSRRKVEGIALDADLRSGWLLTDPDDPERPAELCRIALAG